MSKELFTTALRLAGNRGLFDSPTEDLADRRRTFAEEVRQAIRRVDLIEALVAARNAGLSG